MQYFNQTGAAPCDTGPYPMAPDRPRRVHQSSRRGLSSLPSRRAERAARD
jgi:hypothetical protein